MNAVSPAPALPRQRQPRILCYAAVDCTHAGGVQRMVRSLDEGLRAAGADPRTVWGEGSGAGATGHLICRLHARTLPEPPWLPWRRSHVPSLVRAARLLARVRPDVVNVHFATRAAQAFVALRPLFGYRLVLSLHGSDVMCPTPADAAYLPALLAAADGVTAVSRALGQRARQLAPASETPLRIVPNGIDTRFWSPGEPVAPDRELRLVSVGRLEPVKGFDLLIRALADLRRSGVAARLTLIGGGSQEQALRSLALELGLAGAVDFTGTLPPEVVREQFRRADMFVLSSHSEGMPLALMEAMACGLVCVATRVGGVEEVTGGFVPLVEPGNFAALAKAIAQNATKCGAPCLAGVRRMADYSVDRTNRAYLEFLCGVAP